MKKLVCMTSIEKVVLKVVPGADPTDFEKTRFFADKLQQRWSLATRGGL